MKTMIAFLKKDFLEQFRSGRLFIALGLFTALGIMNPMVAKLTPWLLEVMSDSLAESGMIVTDVKISALDSWVQFFKNMPIALIAFVLLFGTIFTKEYATGTLVLSLTKGLKRYKVVISKWLILATVWSVGYLITFGITYVYNDFFWDNSIAKSLLFSVFCWWLFGMLTVSLVTLFSALALTNTAVLMGVGGVVLLSSVISFLPKISKYLPTYLTDGNSLIYGTLEPREYTAAVIITAIITALSFAVSIPVFNKKQL